MRFCKQTQAVLAQLLCGHLIKMPESFIKYDKSGIEYERSANRGSLAHSAGEFMRIRIRPTLKTDTVQPCP